MQYKNVLRKLYDRAVSDEVNISLAVLVLLIIIVVVPTAISGAFSKESFLENVWADINAMIIELLVLGIFLRLLAKVGARRREIQQYLNEIDDFRFWEDQIAAHRIRGSIFRLNRLGTTQIDLNNCFLENAQLAGVKLINSNLWKANFEGCDLENSELQKSDFWSANLKSAILRNADLSDAKLVNCVLIKADLSGAILKNTSLNNSVLQETDLTGSILDGVDLTGVTNLNPLQLSKAKSAINIKVDNRLLDKARRINPAIFENNLIGDE